jgi:hypothetical protein
MAKGTRPRHEVELENRMLRRTKSSEGIYAILVNVIKYGFLAWVVWNLRAGIECLAGKNTNSNLSLSLITDIKLNEWVAYLIGGGGVLYGKAQNRLRKTTIERIQGRNEKLERDIDPKRSSSSLTGRGETRKEDQ